MINLVIKGNEEVARSAARLHRIDLSNIRPFDANSDGAAQAVTACCADDRLNDVIKWFCEAQNGVPPYPAGTLLLYSKWDGAESGWEVKTESLDGK